MSYDFIIQYCWDILNSANESSQRPDYMMTEQNEEHHESAEKPHESSLKQFQSTSTQNSDSSSISAEDKLIFWQIDDLISTLINKLVTAVLEVGEQYSCCIRETDSETECLIWVLSLQAIT